MILTVGKFLQNQYPLFDLMNISQITLAALLKDKEMLEHLIERYTDKKLISPQVALSGNLQVLKWTIKRMKCPITRQTCWAAAEGGHLNILQYIKSQAYPWDEFTCMSAARRGHLNILKYLRDQGCPWDSSACAGAAVGGHLSILKYLKDQGIHSHIVIIFSLCVCITTLSISLSLFYQYHHLVDFFFGQIYTL